MEKSVFKKVFTVIACLSLGISLNAQVFDVSKFEETEDSDARLAQVKDDNGQLCALIKISSSLDCNGFIGFDAGNAQVVESGCKDGLPFVYISPGAIKLSIRHSSAGNKENYAFPTGALKAGTVYLMTLSGSQIVRNEDLVDVNYFTVRCETPQATIQFDNKEELTFSFEQGFKRQSLKYGQHTYVVKAPMYHDEIGKVTITATKPEDKEITLKPAFGTLVVNTNPEGADILIDGKPQTSKSPLTLNQMPSGTYTVQVQKPMYKPTSKQVTVTDGQTKTETIDLPPNFATITLISQQGGSIYVDEENKGTGKWTGNLPAGDHIIVVKKQSHGERKQSITTVVGKDETITLPKLVPIYGKLDINIANKTISSAKVYIDGTEHSETAPCIIQQILIGEHKIKLVPNTADYVDFEQTVEIQEGKLAKMDATFREAEKFATLKITSTPLSMVSINGTYAGTTPTTKESLQLGQTRVSFEVSGYETLEKTITLKSGYNELSGELEKIKIKQPVETYTWLEYEFSKTAPLGFTFGYCKAWGAYLRFKTDISLDSKEEGTFGSYIVEEADFSKIDFDERKYYRLAVTGGLTRRLFKGCYLYGGLGYGKYGAAYHIVDIDAYYCPDLQKGLEVEGGMVIKLGPISLSGGYSTLLSGSKQRFSDVSVGLGFMF
jgi:hypothetical protein